MNVIQYGMRRNDMPIIYNEKTREFHLYNQEISYIIKILDNDQPGQLYYGKRLPHREDFSHLRCLLKSALFHYSETTRYNLDATTPPFNNLLRLPRSSIALKRNVPLCDCIFGAAPQVGKRYAARHALTLIRNEIQDLFEFRSTTQNLHFKSLYRKIGVSCVISFLQLQITNKCLPLVCGFVCLLFVVCSIYTK